MAWLSGVLTALCLAIGGLHLFRALRRPRGRPLEIGYAVMALGMAGMYSPLGDPVPAPVWVVLFLLGACGFGASLLRARSLTLCDGEALHLLVGSVAMLFMLWADQQAGGAAGHWAHAAGAAGMVGVASAAALVLAAYFVLHTMRCVDRLRVARTAATPVAVAVAVHDTGRGEGRDTVRDTAPAATGACALPLPALAHLLMTAAMAIMLVGMI